MIGTRAGIIAGLLLSSLACEPSFDGVDFSQRTATPEGADVKIEGRLVQIPVGMAVGVYVELESGSSKEFETSHEVRLESEDEKILEIYPIHDREDEWILAAVSVGETCIEVYVDDTQEEDCVTADITAQGAEE